MEQHTKAEIVVIGGVAIALAWLWFANHRATGQTGVESFPEFPDSAGSDVGTLPAVGAVPDQAVTPAGDATFDLGDIYLPPAPAMPSASYNPHSGTGTCGCGCNEAGGQSTQFASSDALASFLASLPQYQEDKPAAPQATIGKPAPFPWATWNGDYA